MKRRYPPARAPAVDPPTHTLKPHSHTHARVDRPILERTRRRQQCEPGSARDLLLRYYSTLTWELQIQNRTAIIALLVPLRQGEPDAKYGSAMRLILGPNPATIRLDDCAGNGQSHTHAMLFGC